MGPCFRIADYRVHEVSAAVEETGAASPVPWHVKRFGVDDARLALDVDGSGVRVAVIDTGLCADHPDLKGRSEAHDYTGEGAQDGEGHGTHCCGIVASVAPGATVVSLKVFGKKGRAVHANIVRALEDIIRGKHKNIRIVNLSLGSGEPSQKMRMLLLKLNARGVAVVCAAGNEAAHDAKNAPRFGTIGWPAHFNSTFAVGSVNKKRRRSAFSSSGPKITVMAPGEKVSSSWLDGGRAVLSGTSMASPFVAGCLALMLERCSKQGIPDPDLGEMLWCFAASSSPMEKSGFDFYTGYGLVRPRQLIEEYEKLKKEHGKAACKSQSIQAT
nr:subtilase family protein [Oceanusvirus sp.]